MKHELQKLQERETEMRFRWNQIFLLAILSSILIACPLISTKPPEIQATTEATETKTRTFTGLVEIGPDGFVITVNWTSRSRASYTVTGPLAGNFKKLIGKIVTATGTVTKTFPFSGTIRVTSVKVEK